MDTTVDRGGLKRTRRRPPRQPSQAPWDMRPCACESIALDWMSRRFERACACGGSRRRPERQPVREPDTPTHARTSSNAPPPERAATRTHHHPKDGTRRLARRRCSWMKCVVERWMDYEKGIRGLFFPSPIETRSIRCSRCDRRFLSQHHPPFQHHPGQQRPSPSRLMAAGGTVANKPPPATKNAGPTQHTRTNPQQASHHASILR